MKFSPSLLFLPSDAGAITSAAVITADGLRGGWIAVVHMKNQPRFQLRGVDQSGLLVWSSLFTYLLISCWTNKAYITLHQRWSTFRHAEGLRWSIDSITVKQTCWEEVMTWNGSGIDPMLRVIFICLFIYLAPRAVWTRDPARHDVRFSVVMRRRSSETFQSGPQVVEWMHVLWRFRQLRPFLFLRHLKV